MTYGEAIQALENQLNQLSKILNQLEPEKIKDKAALQHFYEKFQEINDRHTRLIDELEAGMVVQE